MVITQCRDGPGLWVIVFPRYFTGHIAE